MPLILSAFSNNQFRTSRYIGESFIHMSNYSSKTEFIVNGDNMEIKDKEIIPLDDLFLIKE